MGVVEQWGIGRPDYSVNVEKSVQPIIRSWEEIASLALSITNLASGDTVTYNTGQLDYTHFITNGALTADANVLLELKIYAMPENTLIIPGKGYQRIEFKSDATIPIDNIKLTITNHGDTTVNLLYWHVGVKGLEKVEAV